MNKVIFSKNKSINKENIKSLSAERICFHDSEKSKLHSMIIKTKTNEKSKIHKHKNKDEYFILLEGEMKIYIYNKNKRIIDSISLKSYNDGTFLYKIPKNTWHRSKSLIDSIYIEFVTGPFRRSDTIFL